MNTVRFWILILVCLCFPLMAADKTVVIGGGLAGLTVAYRLHQQGQEVLVLEAQRGVGGRILTESVRIAGGSRLIVEKGAEFVSSDDFYLLRLAESLGVKMRTQAPRDPAVVLIDLHGTVRPLQEWSKLFYQQHAETLAWVQEGISSSLGTSVQDLLNTYSVDSLLQQFFAMVLWTELGKTPNKIPTDQFSIFFGLDADSQKIQILPGVDEQLRIEGGSEQLISGLLRAVDNQVEIETRVHRVTFSDRVFKIYSSNNGRERIDVANQLVLAIPPWQLGHIQWDIEDSNFQQTIDQLRKIPSAQTTKIFLEYDPRIWRPSTLPLIGWSDFGFQFVSSQLNEHRGTILVYTGAVGRGTQAELSEFVQQAVKHLERILPGFAKSYLTYKSYFWEHSYSGVAPLTAEQQDALRFVQRIPGLYVVGEAYSLEKQGYMEAAVRTAESAVAQLKVAQERPHQLVGSDFSNSSEPLLCKLILFAR